MFQTKVVKKITTHILCQETSPLKSYRVCDNVGKLWHSQTCHSNNTTLRMRFASSVTKAKLTLRLNNHHCFSHCNYGNANTALCYVSTYLSSFVYIYAKIQFNSTDMTRDVFFLLTLIPSKKAYQKLTFYTRYLVRGMAVVLMDVLRTKYSHYWSTLKIGLRNC